jgi:GT2 family glycosyltransferase
MKVKNNKLHVSIILLNWNGWEDAIECLESVYQIDYPNYDVIIVDNNSSDDSIEKLREYCEGKISIKSDFFDFDSNNKPIQMLETNISDNMPQESESELFRNASYNQRLILVKNDKNYGFAEGNNMGITYSLRHLHPDYILLLNNDTIVKPDFLENLVKVAEKDEKIGIVGSKVLFYNKPDLIQTAGIKINWYLGEFKMIGYKKLNSNEYDKLQSMDCVSGCSMLIKNDVFYKGIFFNKEYFLYYEDTDFCINTRNLGFEIIYSPDSMVFHKGSISTTKISGIREYYSARNLFIIMKKYSDKKQFFSFLMYYFLFKFWLTGAIILFYHRESKAFIPFIKGVFEGLKISV